MPHAPVQRADRHQFLVADLQIELVVTVVAALQVQRRGTLGRGVVRVRRVPLHRIAPTVGGYGERLVEHHRERVPTFVPIAHVRRVRQLRLGPLARVDRGVPVADLEPPRRPVARSTVEQPAGCSPEPSRAPTATCCPCRSRPETAPHPRTQSRNRAGRPRKGRHATTTRLLGGVAAVVVFREVDAGGRVTLDSAGVGADVGVGAAVGVESVVVGGGGGGGSVATPPLMLARGWGSATSSSGSVLCANCPATAVLAATTTVRTPAVTGAIRRTRR